MNNQQNLLRCYTIVLIFTIGSMVLKLIYKITAFLNAISSTICCSHVLFFNPNPGSGKGGAHMLVDIFLQQQLCTVTDLLLYICHSLRKFIWNSIIMKLKLMSKSVYRKLHHIYNPILCKIICY